MLVCRTIPEVFWYLQILTIYIFFILLYSSESYTKFTIFKNNRVYQQNLKDSWIFIISTKLNLSFYQRGIHRRLFRMIWYIFLCCLLTGLGFMENSPFRYEWRPWMTSARCAENTSVVHERLIHGVCLHNIYHYEFTQLRIQDSYCNF